MFVYGLLLEIVYIAIANVMLSTGILYTLLNRKPAKQQYEWQSAWTAIPGVIRLRHFKMRSRTPRSAWNLAIDDAWLSVNLPALALRSFRVSAIRATGVSAEVYRLKPQVPENAAEAAKAARLPTAANPLSPLHNSSSLSRSSRLPHKWHIRLKRIFVDELTRLDMDGYIWSGHGRVRGTLDMVTRDVMHIPKVKATLSEGTVSFRNEIVAEHLNVTIDHELGPYYPNENPGRKIFNYLSGKARVNGYVSHFGFLNFYLRNIDWLSIAGLGEIDADLHFDNGLLRSSSSLSCRFNRIETRMNDWSISGTGILSGSVSDRQESTDTLIILNLENISLTHPERLPEPAHAPGVVIRMSGHDMRFDSLDSGLSASIDLLDSNISDLSDYNGLLPVDSGIEILPGSSCALELHLDAERNRISGNMGIKGADTGIRFRDRNFRGDLSLSTFLESIQPSTRTINIKDLHLTLSSIRQETPDPQHTEIWDAAISIPDSALTVDRPVSLASNISFRISDSRLLTRIFQTSRRPWFDDLIEFSEISGDASIELTGRATTIRNATLSGKGVMPDHEGVNPFRVNASCDSFDLKNGVAGLKLATKIPPSEIRDLGILNSIIPANSGLMVRPGDPGWLAAEISVNGSRGHGRITIGGKGVGLTLLEQKFEGDLDLEIGATTTNIRSGVLDLSGSTLRLSDFRSLDVPSEPGWWSTLELTCGTMTIGKPLTIHGNLQLKMRDTGPLLNIFQEQSHAVKWLGDILLVEDIHGTGTLRTDATGLHLPDLVLNGENLDIKARMRFTPGSLRGILYARFMGLSMGVELKNGRRSYRLIHPGRWFDSYPWDGGD